MSLHCDWRELEEGKFYRLECGCRGLVVRKHVEPSEEGRDTGFIMAYSVFGCVDQTSHEDSYRRGYGPYTNFFNCGLCDDAMPAEEIEKPSWWEEAIGDRLKKFYPEGR